MAETDFASCWELYCFKDSYGYQYAAKQGIPAETLYAYVTDSVPAGKESQDSECTEQTTGKTIVSFKKLFEKNIWLICSRVLRG